MAQRARLMRSALHASSTSLFPPALLTVHSEHAQGDTPSMCKDVYITYPTLTSLCPRACPLPAGCGGATYCRFGTLTGAPGSDPPAPTATQQDVAFGDGGRSCLIRHRVRCPVA
ncbi:hypothetical protein GQ54DRAFT_193834 [Martensiomyces pterosporus]|nr:hypothetical protein GQ54DRAFT_193834 [Martensiomyces pterosporus]